MSHGLSSCIYIEYNIHTNAHTQNSSNLTWNSNLILNTQCTKIEWMSKSKIGSFYLSLKEGQ